MTIIKVRALENNLIDGDDMQWILQLINNQIRHLVTHTRRVRIERRFYPNS